MNPKKPENDLIGAVITTETPPELIPPVEILGEPEAKPPAPPVDEVESISGDDLLTPRSNGIPQPEGTTSEPEKPRGRGRPPGSKTRKPDFADIAPPVDFTAMAGLLVDMSTGTAATLLGPEWHPRGPEEKKLVQEAVANYLRAKDVKDIPPGMMLTLVIMAYSAPRISQPSTKAKLAYGWSWFKGRFLGFIFRKRSIQQVAPTNLP